MQDRHPPQSLEHYPITFFAVVMGLAGTVLALRAASHAFDLALHFDLAGLIVVGGVFALIAAIYAMKWLRFPAAVRAEFTAEQPRIDAPPLYLDPELRIGLTLVIAVPLLLFLRHWGGVLEVDGDWGIMRALSSIWGGLFMTLSFLSTAGFESAAWENARLWSGLQAPGVLLMGLAIFGGGVATTAGGVKLIRLYALVRHGEREIEKLISPNSVGGAGPNARRIRREGAQVAWVYFMVFAFTIALVMVLLSLFGQSFEEAVVFTVSAITTTGPLVAVAGETALSYADLGAPEKFILAATMIFGRLEMLAIIALLNPDFWRR